MNKNVKTIGLIIVIFCFFLSTGKLYSQVQNNNVSEIKKDSLKGLIIDNLKTGIPVLLEKYQIPGFAIAFVTGDDIKWLKTYGNTSRKNDYPVNNNTLFAIMSCSKSITALGVLMAVQDGLLDLDEPISTYIPDFHINSVYSEKPENEITLMHLLAHRSGLDNDAYCEELNSRPHEIEEYIGNISSTWMNSPVGYKDYYSNIGVDLAGYIIEKVTKMPFKVYMKEKVFEKLGMNSSTYDLKSIESVKNKAVGSWASEKDKDKIPPYYIPMLACGGSYSNINDMSKYLQFHLNKGKVNNKQLLRNDLLDLMHNITFPVKGQKEGYTQGMEVGPFRNSYYLKQEGAGYGFESTVLIYPEFDFGIAFLSNSCWTRLNGNTIAKLVNEISDSYLGKNENSKVSTVIPQGYEKLNSNHDKIKPVFGFYDTNKKIYLKNDSCFIDINGKIYPLNFYMDNNKLIGRLGLYSEISFLPKLNGKQGNMVLKNLWYGNVQYYGFNKPLEEYDVLGPDKPYWKNYTGKYDLVLTNIVRGQFDVTIENGYLTINNQRCFEHLPGLFFNSDGMAFDFREKIPTVATFPLQKEK